MPLRNKAVKSGSSLPPCSQFEKTVKDAPREHVAEVKQRLERSYANSGTDDPKLKKAIAALNTEPGWFLNVNGIYREIITDALRDLANAKVDAPAVASLKSTRDVIAGCISRLVRFYFCLRG